MSPDQQQPAIVVGLDCSSDSELALTWSVGLAQATGARVHAVMVIPPDYSFSWMIPDPQFPVGNERSHERIEHLERARKSFSSFVDVSLPEESPVPVTNEVIEGEPAGALIDLAGEMDAAALVVGRRGKGGFKRLLLGSVSSQCAEYSDRPTIVVRGEPFPTPDSSPLVVAGIDGSPSSDEALVWAAQVAHQLKAKLKIVCAWRVPELAAGSVFLPLLGLDYYPQMAEKTLDDSVARNRDALDGIEWTVHSAEGHPGDVINQVAKADHPVLVVVGSRGRGELVSALLGSVSHSLVNHCPSSVAVIHSRRDEPNESAPDDTASTAH